MEESMKALRILIAVLVIMLGGSGAAMAIDPSGCFYIDEFGNEVAMNFGPGWVCEGRLEFSDLATIDENGSVIVGGPLSTEVMEWHSGAGFDPMSIMPFHNVDIDDGSFQIRHYSDGTNSVRVNANVGMVVYTPQIWSAYCNDVDAGCPEYNVGVRQFFGNFDVDGVVEFDEYQRTLIDPNRLTVTWEDKGLVADTYIQTYDMNYVKYKLYPINFWDFENAYIENGGADMVHAFNTSVLPDVGVQTVKFHLDANDPSGGYFTYKTYNVTTVEPMPTVAATKEVDGVTTIKIGAKEKKIGLKVTWNDPPFKDIMKPWYSVACLHRCKR
jgi:hypothetical protein